MSALPLKADIRERDRHVRLGPGPEEGASSSPVVGRTIDLHQAKLRRIVLASGLLEPVL